MPSESATHFAFGYYKAGHGTLEQSCRQGCKFDGVSEIWWRLVEYRVRKLIARNQKGS